MKNLLKINLKMSLKLSFLFAIILLLIALIVAFSNYYSPEDTGGFELFIKIIGNSGNSLFPIFLFIIPILSFSLSYLTEINSKIFMYMVQRINIKDYIYSKFFANYIIGFFTGFIPLILMLLITIIVLDFDKNITTTFSNGFLVKIIEKSPFLYSIIMILIQSTFAAVWSCFGLALSVIIKNKYITLALPILIYFVTGITFELIGILKYDLITLVVPSFISGVTITSVMIRNVLLLSISFTIFYLGVSKNNNEFI